MYIIHYIMQINNEFFILISYSPLKSSFSFFDENQSIRRLEIDNNERYRLFERISASLINY